MKDKSVLITGLARDCDKNLLNNIQLINLLCEKFKYSEILIVENDSKDKTKIILNDWLKINSKLHVISFDANSITFPSKSKLNPFPGTSQQRIEKMVKYRNIYMNWINSKRKKFKYDYLIVIDFDIVSFSVDGLVDSIKNAPENWGGLFANGQTHVSFFGTTIHRMYHDAYALLLGFNKVLPLFTTFDMFENKKYVTRRLQNDQYVEVASAFSGIGVYKYDLILKEEYFLLNNNDKFIKAYCEHIPFNLRVLNKGFKNYICKEMFVDYGKSDFRIFLRMIMPLKLFKVFVFIFAFKKLKE